MVTIDAVEELVDGASLCSVLEALSCMCSEKANHIRENWQDDKTARPWDQMARKLQRLANQCDV